MRSDELFDGKGTSRFTKDGYFSWVATEGLDIGLDPGKSLSLVEESGVLFPKRNLWRAGETKDYPKRSAIAVRIEKVCLTICSIIEGH